MEGYDFEAAASTIKIEDITTDNRNRVILLKLKENDPDFDKLWVCEEGCRDDNEYCPEDSRDSGWLGYFIGQNRVLLELHLRANPFQNYNTSAGEVFGSGVNRNRSIQKISFQGMNLMGGEIFQSLRPFFADNNNLSELGVGDCQFGAVCTSQLSVTLGVCNKSLKSICLNVNQMGGERLVEIIAALSAHPQLKRVVLVSMNMGTNECTALSTVVRSMTRLHTLNLNGNNIDDEGVDALVDALNNNNLRILHLSFNRNITARGYQSLAGLLEQPNSNLEKLYLNNNNIVGNEGARAFANALASNRKLQILALSNNGITADGWSSFSKVLCDTSSINKTFLSNHTLERLGVDPSRLPVDVRALLTLNESSDKTQVAIKKIIHHHRHFNMQPFLEWDLKVLPIAVNWFDRAISIENDDDEDGSDEDGSDEDDTNNGDAGIRKHKLGAIYQFIRAMPEVLEPTPVAAGGEKRKRHGI